MARILVTVPADPAPRRLADAEYLACAEAVLSAVEATVDRLLQDDVVDIDGRRTGGMLELRFPDTSVIVLNMQPPLQELWLAARSGGFHFRFADGRWIDTRETRDFFTVLSECATAQAGMPLRFEPGG